MARHEIGSPETGAEAKGATPSYLQRAQLWLLANVVTALICSIMVLARVLLACIESLHACWPARLDWVSDAVYSRAPLLQAVFSHRFTRGNVRTIAEIAASCSVSIDAHEGAIS